MQVRLLGPVGLADGDKWTWLRGARVRTVLAALRDADLIVVLADGVIVERGPHEDLVAAGGGYADMFHLQAAGYAA